jgi:hypothetical protein
MTTRLLVSALALSLLAVAPAAAEAKAKPAPCVHPGSKTLASSSTARIYRVALKDRDPGTSAVYGCLRSPNRTSRLLTESDDGIETSTLVTAAALSGRYAVYVISDEDLSCKAACPPGFEPLVQTLRVADLKRRTSRVLDRGNIDPKSLKVSGSTVSWTKDGDAKSAPVAPQGSGTTKAAKTCSKRGSTTVASSSIARVYSVAASGDDDTTDIVYGCLRSTDRRTRLAEEYDDNFVLSGSVDAVKLGGRYVLVLFTATDISCKADCPPGYQPSRTRLSATNLKTRKHSAIGSGNIDPKSLRITGTTATWTVDGTSQSATLS